MRTASCEDWTGRREAADCCCRDCLGGPKLLTMSNLEQGGGERGREEAKNKKERTQQKRREKRN
jgi:hypothetical protein